MATVGWEKVPRETYEKMVSVLISRLNPDALRIDGAGGDEGRDVQIRRGAQLDLFELKSHTGRVGPSQRAQIRESLKRASALESTTWTLVIPIDPTPRELAWFQNLQKTYSFPLHWRGRTWLDNKMSQFPDIPRYFLYSGADEAYEILKELRRDEAEFAEGIEHVVNRVEGWVTKLGELDPMWNFQISRTSDGHYSITPVPKYLGAERDRPIRISLTSIFPDTAEAHAAREALEAAINFGRGATLSEAFVEEIKLLEGPSVLNSIGKGPVAISPPPESKEFRAEMTIAVVDLDNRTLAAVPLKFTERTTGLAGSELTGTDSTGALKIRLRGSVESPGLGSDFNYSFPPDALPAQVLPVVRLLARMHPPNQVRLRSHGKDMTSSTSMSIKGGPTKEFVERIEALARIQQSCGIYFPVPKTFSKSDLDSISTADRLMNGESVPSTWKEARLSLGVTDPPMLAELIVANYPRAFKFVDPGFAVNIAGHEVPLGDVEVTLASAQLGNADELERRLPLLPGQEIEVLLVPADSDTVELRRFTDVESH